MCCSARKEPHLNLTDWAPGKGWLPRGNGKSVLAGQGEQGTGMHAEVPPPPQKILMFSMKFEAQELRTSCFSLNCDPVMPRM